MNAINPQPIKIFIAYSRKDKSYLTRLRTHLTPLIETENLAVWHDGEMMAGTKWKAEIKKHLDEADIILLLISADALSSKPFKNEMTSAFERHAQGKVVLIPTILRTCHWEIIPSLKELQALPENGNPVTKWDDKEDAYADIARGIGDSINSIKKVDSAWGDLVETNEELLESKNEDGENISVTDIFFTDSTNIITVKEDEKIRLPSNQLNDEVFAFFRILVVGLIIFIPILRSLNAYNKANSKIEGKMELKVQILEANKLRIEGKYADSMNSYKKIHPFDSIEANKGMKICQREMANESQSNSMYSQLINEGNNLFNDEKYNFSLEKYVRALELKKDGEEAKKGISNCMKAKAKVKEIVEKIMNNMVLVKGGIYKGENDERHSKIQVSSFYINKYEVTQEQWQIIMESNPSKFNSFNQYPVEQVSLDEVQKFIKNLNLITNKTFRLPAKNEWLFAAKGGIRSMGYIYAGSDEIDDVAWYNKNSHNKIHPVGSKFPNELGLYDMSGNLWEWYYNWSDSIYHEKQGIGRFGIIGGSWNDKDSKCRIDSSFYRPNSAYNDIGFRLAQTL